MKGAGAERGFLVGTDGFGEVIVSADDIIVLPDDWYGWEQVGLDEEADQGHVVLRNWQRIAIPDPLRSEFRRLATELAPTALPVP